MSLELSGTTGVKGVAGSVSAPSIVGDDTNTGISFPAADTIKFSTGGVERMSITNSGVTGVGGNLRQFKYVNFSSTYSTTSSSYQHVSGLDLAFTPTASDSILVYDLMIHVRNQEASGTAPNSFIAISIDGGSNYLYVANNYQIFSGITGYLVLLPLNLRFATVAGSTSARTYSVRVRLNGYSGTGDTLTLTQNSGEIQMASVTEYAP